MKVASMTDVDVFFMVQTADGRRFFTGKSSLTDCYLNHRLVPSCSDVQLELAPNICALRQKHPTKSPDNYAGFYVKNNSPFQMQQPFDSRNAAKPRQPDPSPGLPSQQRHHSLESRETLQDSPHSRFSQSSSNETLRRQSLPQRPTPSSNRKHSSFSANGDSSAPGPLKKHRHDSKPNEGTKDHNVNASATDPANGTANANSPEAVDVKCESAETVVESVKRENSGFELDEKLKESLDCQVIESEGEDDGDEDDVTIIDDIDDEARVAAVANETTFAAASNQPQRHSQYRSTHISKSHLYNPQQPDLTDPFSSLISSLVSKIITHPKLEAVLLVCDASVAEKDSIASKLLNSLLYEYAKLAAHECPYDTVEDPRCKEFYSCCFEGLWVHLPNLQKLHQDGLKVMSGRKSRESRLKSAMRETMRKCFRVIHRKKLS